MVQTFSKNTKKNLSFVFSFKTCFLIDIFLLFSYLLDSMPNRKDHSWDDRPAWTILRWPNSERLQRCATFHMENMGTPPNTICLFFLKFKMVILLVLYRALKKWTWLSPISIYKYLHQCHWKTGFLIFPWKKFRFRSKSHLRCYWIPKRFWNEKRERSSTVSLKGREIVKFLIS